MHMRVISSFDTASFAEEGRYCKLGFASSNGQSGIDGRTVLTISRGSWVLNLVDYTKTKTCSFVESLMTSHTRKVCILIVAGQDHLAP